MCSDEPIDDSAGQASREQCVEWASIELNRGVERQDVIDSLIASGWNSADASSIVARAEAPVLEYRDVSGQRSDRLPLSQARQRMLLGVIFMAGGLFTTIGTYATAWTLGGGTYLIIWGPVVWGLIYFVRGWSEYRDAQLPLKDDPRAHSNSMFGPAGRRRYGRWG